MKTSMLVLLPAILLASCKKEIQLKMKPGESLLVIEADLNATKPDNTIRITKTGGVTETTAPQAAGGAQVIVSDGAGYQEILTEENAGEYHTHSFSGVAGRTYYLSVRIGNKTYVAQSTIQQPVPLADAYVVKEAWGNMPMQGFMPVYTDPAGLKNNYRFVQYLNGKRLPGSVVRSDEYNDGMPNTEPILIRDLALEKGDTVLAEMQNIDPAVYKYFSSKEQTANMESAAPANPVTNISNGALGYFNVYIPQYKMMVVQE